jgi:hypothetical protein
MPSLPTDNLSEAIDHEVLSRSYEYDVIGFGYKTQDAPYGSLELKLKKNATEVLLRFDGVHELELDAGFPHSCMGLAILDVSYLRWEHAKVRVQSFEEAPCIRFWAREVSRVE